MTRPPQRTFVTLPPTIQAVVDADADWFTANPACSERIRPYVSGEMTDERGVEHRPASGLIRVICIHGPVRVRFASDTPITSEIRQMFTELRAKLISEGR